MRELTKLIPVVPVPASFVPSKGVPAMSVCCPNVNPKKPVWVVVGSPSKFSVIVPPV